MLRIRLALLALITTVLMTVGGSAAQASATASATRAAHGMWRCEYTEYVPVGPRHFVRIIEEGFKKHDTVGFRRTLYIRHQHAHVYRWLSATNDCDPPLDLPYGVVKQGQPPLRITLYTEWSLATDPGGTAAPERNGGAMALT